VYLTVVDFKTDAIQSPYAGERFGDVLHPDGRDTAFCDWGIQQFHPL
jgi:hypothetical protein